MHLLLDQSTWRPLHQDFSGKVVLSLAQSGSRPAFSAHRKCKGRAVGLLERGGFGRRRIMPSSLGSKLAAHWAIYREFFPTIKLPACQADIFCAVQEEEAKPGTQELSVPGGYACLAYADKHLQQLR